MTTTKTGTAREYLRVSLDRSGRERSITEQQDDNRRSWPALDFNGTAYSDVSISASRYTTKVRGGYGELIADLGSGRFGAETLVLWEASRGSRRVGEWVTLVELCEERGVTIAVTSEARTYDPANPRDRRSLLEDAVDAEYESAKISARAKRAAAAGAAQGRAHGRVPFGYRSVYDTATGRPVGREPEPTEAAVVVELYERVAAGHSFRGIAADFAERGITKRGGAGPFTPQHLRTMVRTDAHRGKRIHIPGRKGGRPVTPDTQVVDAQWPAIVPEQLWLAVQHVISDPSRKTTRGGGAKHLLSMIARCDVCDGPLSATYRRGAREYACHQRSCVRVLADDLDKLAEDAIVGFLSDPANVARFTAPEGTDEALDAARTDAAAIQAELDEVGDLVGRREMTPKTGARAEAGLLARQKAVENRIAALSTPPALRGMVGPGEDVEKRWADAETLIEVRRDVARALLVRDKVGEPKKLGELRITRSTTPGHRCPVKDRVNWAH